MIRQFKINGPLKNIKKDTIISLECDEEGIPTDNYWFRRYKDSAIDKCIEPVEKQKLKLKDKKDESI